jgi:hypothetical protein
MATWQESPPPLTPFFQRVELNGRIVWFSSDDRFAVQVGKGRKGAYKNKYVVQGFERARFYYAGINLGPGYKKRLVSLSNKKAVLKTAFSGLP